MTENDLILKFGLLEKANKQIEMLENQIEQINSGIREQWKNFSGLSSNDFWFDSWQLIGGGVEVKFTCSERVGGGHGSEFYPIACFTESLAAKEIWLEEKAATRQKKLEQAVIEREAAEKKLLADLKAKYKS